MQRRTLIAASLLLGTGAAVSWMLRPRAADLPGASSSPVTLVPVARGLDYPWGLAFLPDGSALVTERPGRLRRITLPDGTLGEPVQGTPAVDATGQGGLLGLALAPDFASTRQVFLSFARPTDGGNATAVFRGRLSEDFARLEDGAIIFTQNHSANSGHHFGSRLVFDREGHLFVTTGDRNVLRDEVQNPATHIGKVLRITRDGAPAPGNPALPGWAPEVWSLGHRNLQGATLHPETGALWTVEHGARGGDEVNTPQAGKNYGWPVISYGSEYSMLPVGEGTAKDGMEQPVHYWDPSIAPSGMTFVTSDTYPGWRGNLLVGALAGQHIARLVMDGGRVVAEEKLFEGSARFRDVVQGPGGSVYALTDGGAPDGMLMVITPE